MTKIFLIFPTFSRQTLRVEEARPLVVYAEEDTPDGDVRPIQGRLYDLTGFIPLPAPPNFTVTVTLASDLGRMTSNAPAFRFPTLAPGHYELYAEARENPPGTRAMGGYAELFDRAQHVELCVADDRGQRKPVRIGGWRA